MNYKVYTGQIQGARETQEDELGVVDTGFCLLAAVADGLGGHPWGEVASKLAVTACLQHTIENCDHDDLSPNDLLAGALARARESVNDTSAKVPRYRNMGTTLASILIKDDVLYRGWVGDSLILRRRHRNLDILGSPWGKTGSMTDALMFGAGFRPEGLEDRLAIQLGDIYLLATDGIAVLDLDAVKDCMNGADEPSQVVHRLLRRVEDRADPAQDNCTVVCVFAT